MREKLVKIIKDHVWISSIVAGLILWLFQTFATIQAVAEKEGSLRAYVDEKHRGVENRLDDIKAIVERTDQRVYDLHRNR